MHSESTELNEYHLDTKYGQSNNRIIPDTLDYLKQPMARSLLSTMAHPMTHGAWISHTYLHIKKRI